MLRGSVKAIFLFFVALVVMGQATKSLRTGQYLSEKYIEVLKKTHSPKEAETTSPFAMYCEVKAPTVKGAAYELNIGNFHEGYGRINIRSDGSLCTDEASRESGAANAKIKILNNESFNTLIAGEPPARFKYVGNVHQFVASETIAGKYEDPEGHAVYFGLDGIALFPGKSYRYVVNTDFFGPPDYECVFLSDVPFAYALSKDTLILYATYGDHTMKVDSKPAWVLKKKGHA